MKYENSGSRQSQEISAYFQNVGLIPGMEKWLGVTIENPRVILAPLLRGKGGYGVPVNADGKIANYAIAGAQAVTGKDFYFGDAWSMHILVTHEIIHGVLANNYEELWRLLNQT
jgi:hypothetical protein